MNAFHDFASAIFPLFWAVLHSSWQGSLGIVLVLLLRQFLGGRVPARWRYLLWFLVIVRLLVPAVVLPHSRASMENIPVVARPFEQTPLPVTSVSPIHETEVFSISSNSRTLPAPASAVAGRDSWSWWTAVAWLWLSGAIALGTWLVASAVCLNRRVRRETVPADPATIAAWQACCRRWLRSTPPRVLLADWVQSPALVGIWKPTLLLPRRSPDSFSAQDWEHIFAHEIAHLRSRDQWSQLLLLAAWCVHWFNPVMWVGFRYLRADRELAADEWALRRWDSERALAYGETLLKTLAGAPGKFAFQPGVLGLSEDGAQMKQRLRRITAYLPQSRLYGSLAGFAVLLGLAAVVLGQKSSPSPHDPAPAQSAAPASAQQALPAEMLAAAHAGDANKVSELLHEKDDSDTKQRDFGIFTAFATIQEALRLRDIRAFTTMYDLFQTTAFGKDWKVNDDALAALVKDGRTDFLDVLLARGLDLKRLSAQTGVADPATAAWIARRVVEVGKQRADIEALCKAASNGDLPTIRRLLAQGVDVNCVGKDNNTPLIRAVFKNRLEAAQLLIDKGAQVDKPRFPGWNYTPLCLVNCVPMAELLKKNGADVHARLFGRNVSILTYAACFAKADVVEWFLKQGLDPKMIGDNGETLLFQLKDAGTAKLLLDAGVDPNRTDDSGTPPIVTAQSAEVAQTFIEHGARLTGFKEPLLPMMVDYNSAGAMEAVLKAGADHDQATLQRTLTNVERFGQEDNSNKEKMRALLLAYGAKPVPQSSLPTPQTVYDIPVSTLSGVFLGDGETEVLASMSMGSGGGMQTNNKVEREGTAPVWVLDDCKSISLAAVRKGFAPALAGPFEAPLAEKLKAVSLSLTQGFRASVIVVDETGHTVSGANLKGYYPGPPRIDGAEAVTDGSGTAVLEHLASSPLNLQVTADGFQADEIDDIHLDPARPYRWTLKKAQSLSGTVTAAETGQPIAGAMIKLAGVRGPHEETNGDPSSAPTLTTSDAQGRFNLTSLRPDSTYYLFVSAPGRGGQFLEDIKTSQNGLKVALGPELTVRGKVIHIQPGNLFDGQYTGQYDQSFKFGNAYFATGNQITMKPKNGEADFTISALYKWPVEIRIGGKEIDVEAKDLPKSDLVIDVATAPPR